MFISQNSESVKCRFSKCRFSALNLKFDFISDGGCTREKQIQKALGSLPPCGNRCRFSECAISSSRVHPPSEIKSNFKFKTLRWRPLRWRLTLSEKQGRAKGDGPKVTEPNLRFPAVFCENLRFAAKICGFLRSPNAGLSRRRGESAKICFLGPLCHLSSVTLSAPRQKGSRAQTH